MKWFGESWGAPLCQSCPHIDTPIGEKCIHCDLPIAEGDQGVRYINGPVAHLDCLLEATGVIARKTGAEQP